MMIRMTVRTKLSTCARKQRFFSMEDAQAAVVRATVPLRPYACDRCRQFHLTSRTKGMRTPAFELKRQRQAATGPEHRD
jgi:hypothetical protein